MNTIMRAVALAAALSASAAVRAQTVAPEAGPGVPGSWSAQLADKWSGLWRNADQRGQALLASDPKAAAATFADPRRKAYAELKAGDYQGAAADLAPFRDVDALYNRGGALAHAGDLQGALDAYDAALKLDPKNRDAQHNRDLVAAALKKNPPPPPKDGDKNGKDNKPGEGKNDGASGSQSGAKEGKEGKPGDAKDAQKNAQSGKPGDKPGDKPADKPGDKPGSADGKDGQGAGAPPAKPAAPGQGQAPAGADGAGKPGDQKAGDAEQARRDIAAIQAGAAKPGAPPPVAPKTEQQIARDEWLRSIPDDPGGLLRRKFLIEHMMRQRSGQ